MYVFVYGSLLWDTIPFSHSALIATLPHYQRALCIWSIHGRGTAMSPGLYWGVVPAENAICTGKLLKFSDPKMLDWMDKRESQLYIRTEIQISGITAFVYLPNTSHTQYDPRISEQDVNAALN